MKLQIDTLITPILEKQKQHTRPRSYIQARSNSKRQELRFWQSKGQDLIIHSSETIVCFPVLIKFAHMYECAA